MILGGENVFRIRVLVMEIGKMIIKSEITGFGGFWYGLKGV